MLPETQKKVLPALEKMIIRFGRVMGCDGYDAVMNFVIGRMKESQASEAIVRSVIVTIRGSSDGLEGDKLYAILSAVGSREKLNETIAEMPEPDRQTAARIIAYVKNLPMILRQQVLPMAKMLPNRAGRAPSLTPDERASVRDKVRKRIRLDVGVKEAQRQVADLEGIHLRTVQRICAEIDY